MAPIVSRSNVTSGMRKVNNRLTSMIGTTKDTFVKRKAKSPANHITKRRNVLGDITSNTNICAPKNIKRDKVGSVSTAVPKKPAINAGTILQSRTRIGPTKPFGVSNISVPASKKENVLPVKQIVTTRLVTEVTTTTTKVGASKISTKVTTRRSSTSTSLESVPEVHAVKSRFAKNLPDKVKKETVKIESKTEEEIFKPRRSARLSSRRSDTEGSSLYVSALDELPTTCSERTATEKSALDVKIKWNEEDLPTFDKETLKDPDQIALYAMDIFEYLKSRETKFVASDYMPKQTSINARMRSMLVDWMVEVQENFELNHETLYLAVKYVDLFLSKVLIDKNKLQLVGASAMLIASKYDEHIAPSMDEFIYICDGAYVINDIMSMEQKMICTLGYELGVPISYAFLRRYARAGKYSMNLLTLARFVLELSLLNYSAIALSESKQAAAALYLALRMTKGVGWNDELAFYSGYELKDFKDIVLLFNGYLKKPAPYQLQTIKNKYSHQVFFEVAKTKLLEDSDLGL